MRKGEKTRSEIIQTATRLFSEKGVYRIGFPELAREVGLSHAALYRYFADQDALFLACVELAVLEGRASLDQRINPSDPAEKRLRAYIDGNVAWFSGGQLGAQLLLAVFYFAASNPAIAEFHNRFIAASLSRLGAHISQGMHEGAWPAGGSQAKARAIHNLMVGEMIKTLNNPSEMTQKARSRLLWTAVRDILLH